MSNRRTDSGVILLAGTAISALLVFQPALAYAAEPVIATPAPVSVPTATAYPEAGYWKPSFSGAAQRVPGELMGVQSSPAGSVVMQNPGYDSDTDVIVGSGPGREPSVGIYRGDGSLRVRFAVYDPGMKWGVNVASGDVDGDGQAEIITGTQPGAAAHVLVFDGQGQMKLVAGGFFPFGRDFSGGVSVATGDVDGDGLQEIVTAAASAGEPRVSVWKKPFAVPVVEFLAFDKTMIAGVSVAAGDVNGDGHEEILVVPAGKGDSVVRIFSLADVSAPTVEFKAGDVLTAGLNLASADFDGDGLAEIVVTPMGPGTGQVSVYDRAGKLRTSFEASAVSYPGGWLTAVGRLGAPGGELVLAVPANQEVAGRPTLPKYIAVSVTDQRLRAYEYGHEVNTFLVSTGVVRHATPLGDFSILAKVPKVHFKWFYGPGNPDNFDLGWTPWSLLIMPHIYIHYAPWHNQFGHRFSHGCVNVNLTNALWIYKWAEVGVPVNISG